LNEKGAGKETQKLKKVPVFKLSHAAKFRSGFGKQYLFRRKKFRLNFG
jgi:hypothetical protein